jgi:hypothetical protein
MFDDRDLISGAQLAALRPALRSPTVYTQRLVEHLDFLPQGGQRWRRDLQILIPEVEGISPEEDHWLIVSLGQFRRRRLPDFTVTDCAGRALNLLTRVQHGHCLADFTLDQYLTDPERDGVQRAAESDPGGTISRAYTDVYMPTFEMFTSVRKDLAPVAEGKMAALLAHLGTEEVLAVRRAALFMEDMTDVAKVTQYLCWVRGRPGSAVRLTATYTMPDPARLAGPDPTDGSEMGSLSRLRAASRKWRSEQYARLGIGPVHYSFPTPANDHAASYYFSIEPPSESSIPYLDWGLENTIEGDGEEWVCAHNSVHVHNGAGLLVRGEKPKPRRKIPESKIHAFLRLDPADHKQVMFAALLNLIFVWLAEAGRLSSQIDGAAASLLAFTPAVLLAYVAQQRRHYFAGATRRVRAVIWGYLLFNIVFALSITFDIASSGSFADRHGFSDDFVSILMAATSIVVFWVFTFVGRPYEWVVRQSFKFARWRDGRKRWAGGRPESTVHSYVRVARWYGNLAGIFIAISLAAMAAVLLTGNGPNRPASAPASQAKPKPSSSATPERLTPAGSRAAGSA